jgi:hypothetical protein
MMAQMTDSESAVKQQSSVWTDPRQHTGHQDECTFC